MYLPALAAVKWKDFMAFTITQERQDTPRARIMIYRPIRTPEDFIMLQSDIDSLTSWTEQNFLQFNADKYKYMWQSHVEIEGYSVAYFDRIAVFEAPYR